MKTKEPKTIYLKDYQPFPYAIAHVDLVFDIHAGHTWVTSKLKMKRLEAGSLPPLFLNGEGLELVTITLDGNELKKGTNFEVDDKGMTMPAPANREFTLDIVTKIVPEENTRLEGLYMSGGNYCTQCEAEGFRRITYYPDRPDVMTTFSVRIQADVKKCPVLLSNGNLAERGDLAGNRHYAVWRDPFPKPCYLFALVAGDLTQIHDIFTTKSGRKVDLYIYVRHGDEGQCAHAMESLKRSMKWDEDVYGLEYDLDLFNIVAVSDFNMGAMENKSLNIFNTALVLAQQETATDGDFIRVESVIAHEYFHNWSGNRVTCRDWFQLSLKEGLTVFRDQEFSADLHSRAVQRIDDVTHLRRLQFPEDAGPLSHPIRPDNYIEINNFYTMTIYEKGAEVIRMMRTILGPENYRKGTDLYFSRHDGQAATCDDFVKCMEDATGKDLSQFKLWYSQAGTPQVIFSGHYEADKKAYVIELSQSTPPTPGQASKKPLHIPVAIGLVDDTGADMDLGDGQTTKILHLTKEREQFVIENIAYDPVPSVLRGFSAPVKLAADLSDQDLAFLMVYDSDGFNRWEAGQTLALRVIGNILNKKTGGLAEFAENFGVLLAQAGDTNADKALLARSLALPDISFVAQYQEQADPPAIYEAILHVMRDIKNLYGDKIVQFYNENRSCEKFSIVPQAVGQRSLQNILLRWMFATNDKNAVERAKAQYDTANNMTDRIAALSVLADTDTPERKDAFSHFYDDFKTYPLVVDKWFSLQAAAIRPTTIETLKELRKHEQFNIRNPNRVRSLYASFAMSNSVRFHAADGSGYEFLAGAIIELNEINPQIAARLCTPLRDWKKYTEDRQRMMKNALESIAATANLSPDVYEIVSKSLKA